jgi:hypothetical protein
MSCRPVSFRRFLAIFSAALCVAVSPVRSQISTPITTNVTRDYVFPPVGLGSSETASITVVNTASSSSGETGTPAQTPSCTGTISFSNANGMIGTPSSFTVGSEGFKTITMPFASAGLTGNRGEIQGKVSLDFSSSTPCSAMFSMETYDSTTFATHVVLSNSPATLTVGPPIFLPFQR